MFGFGSTNTGPPPSSNQSGNAPQINLQQAAGLASAAYGVHQSLPPEMQAKVNQYAADQATAYAHQKLGIPPPQNQTPGATSTPTTGFSCLSLFGMGSSPPPTPAAAVPAPTSSTGHAPTASGGSGGGGMMDMASSLFSFGAAPHKPEPADDPNSFTHLWQAAGEPPKQAQAHPAPKPAGFDLISMFTGQQQQPKQVPPAH